jgi:hypothetical protein
MITAESQPDARRSGCARTAALQLGLAASTLAVLSGCGADPAPPPPKAAPAPASPSSTAPAAPRHALEGSFFIGYGEEGDYFPRAGTAHVISDGERYRILVTGNGQFAGGRFLLVFDGHRLLSDDSDSAPPVTIYDKPHENPDALGFGSGFVYDPQMEPWVAACAHHAPVLTSTGTKLGRRADFYRCPAPADLPDFWVDHATALVLQTGRTTIRHLSAHPSITASTFSTVPRAGVAVRVVAAR